MALISLVDAILSIVCLADEDSDPESFVCQGISGYLAKAIGAIFYGFNLVVDLTNDGLVSTGKPDFDLVNPAAVTLPVTATLYLSDIESLGALVNADSFYSAKNVKKTNLDFALVNDPNSAEASRTVKEGANAYSWRHLAYNDKGSEPDYAGTTTITGTGTFSTTGANALVKDFYFSMAFAVPGIECATVVCWEYVEKDSMTIQLADVAFDVLPATFDEFVTMLPSGASGGYTFGWGGSGQLPFPIFRDADGDGLTSAAKLGNDPNDNNPDTDGDGLTDTFEVVAGLNPNSSDTDSDGLDDYAEFIEGTDPARPDTDSDGLTDAEEVAGWTIVYDGNKTTLVKSNPLEPNTDFDAYSDALEKVYGFNPTVANSGDIMDVTLDFTERVEVEAVQPCATLTLDSLTVQTAVRDNQEPFEFSDAEIAILIDDERVWFQEGLVISQTVSPLNVSRDYCSEELILDVMEIDQGDWSDDRIGRIIFGPSVGAGSGVEVLESLSQGSKVQLAWSKSVYGGATVTASEPSDSYVAPGQELTAFSTVENQLNHRNALGLLDLEIPAGWSGSRLYDQPFILPPQQQTVIQAPLTVDNTISQTGSYSLTANAGALLDPDINPVKFRTPYTPTLHVTFDGNAATAYGDSSPNGLTIDHIALTSHIEPNRDPVPYVLGSIREAADFQLGDALKVRANSALSLNGGSFTIAAWIQRATTTTHEAIVGYMPKLDEKDAYPTLWADCGRLKLYFGDGTNTCATPVGTSIQELEAYNWQHVAATFDASSQSVTLYIDGTPIQSYICSPAVSPNQGNQLWIGRATDHATIKFEKMYINEEDGDIYPDKGEFTLAGRYNGSPDGQAGEQADYRLWTQSSNGATRKTNHSINKSATIEGDQFYRFRLWERDNCYDYYETDGSTCPALEGTAGDESAVYKATRNDNVGKHTDSWDNGYHGGDGTLHWEIEDDSLYMNGRIDDLRLYKQVLPAEAIHELFLRADNTLQLRLDEPPGAYVQYDYSGSRHDGYCEGSACPKSGVSGRSSQAAEFDGVNDYVTLDSLHALRLDEDEFTVSAWVKGDGAVPSGVVLSNDMSGSQQLAMGIAGNGKPYMTYGSVTYSWQAPLSSADRWYHVTWGRWDIFGLGDALVLWVDGFDYQVYHSLSLPALSDVIMYGGGTPSGSYFSGVIDRMCPAAIRLYTQRQPQVVMASSTVLPSLAAPVASARRATAP